ncbi:zinc finger protein, putative [Entamoeba dispar SAW760]|uniref:Zinc finger protein, putative n=1 Tax=Entamoeba dispar (strain ATCC PRA-260 / SAW760) TaxID=370354 RepID=B0EL88_ENTDS|nr:zinc finger protein, putative [Entamoeba dispar SAW760]XP_001741138.1 zinc finger protein, putative [Entamoeba dispar SAW760]EDR22415.1 zinc finger protein, putative [Entamoeba dispar SAW760]EDR24702.1 zinc finger protein, putative [Entamoeba dispar SAW760]|eukprot:EDR22415.1 zinc finger protein, putative [Entamoeba dispar SAW760]
MESQIEHSVNIIYDKFISKKNTTGKYMCPHEGCGKCYDSEESLHRHMNRHSTIKEHICEFCGKAFLRKSECEIHVRIHTGVKPYCCSICQKRFARATDLKIHMLYHSDEKPFQCPFPGCTLRFKRKSDAKKHLRIHVKKIHGNVTELISPHCSAFKVVPKQLISIEPYGVMYYCN